jgi:hypothetical protein
MRFLNWFHAVPLWLRSLFQRTQVEQELVVIGVCLGLGGA